MEHSRCCLHRWLLGVALLGIALFGVFARDASATESVGSPSTPVVLHAARVFDGEKLLGPHWVLVEKGVITKISATPLNAGSVIELGDATLLSGLADVHVHLLLQGLVPAGHNRRLSTVEETSAEKALAGLWAAQQELAAGFTTLRDPGDADVGHAHLDVRDAINDGKFIGPHITCANHAITRTGGHYDDNWLASDQHILPFAHVVDGETAILKAVREEVKSGAEWIKVAGSGGYSTPNSLPDVPTFTDEELRVLVREAHRLKRKVAAHAYATAAFDGLIRAGVDSIEHGDGLTAEQLREMGRRGIYWVPTWYTDPTPDEHDSWLTTWRKDESTNAKRLMKAALAANVPIAFGTDGGLYKFGDGARMFALLVEAGMKPIDAVRSATVVAARMLGDSRGGRVLPGMRADLIAVRGNPLDNIRVLEAVQFVMINGVVARPAP